MGIHLWIVAIGSLLLLVASAFISGSEIAFFSLTPQDRQALEEAEDVPSKMVFDLLNTPDAERGARQLLATILVLNNTVNINIVNPISVIANNPTKKNQRLVELFR